MFHRFLSDFIVSYQTITADKKTILIVKNALYPLPLTILEGARANFLLNNGSQLQISMSNLTSREVEAFVTGEMKGGMLQGNGAILFIWQFFIMGFL
jgi:hypothetical protein